MARLISVALIGAGSMGAALLRGWIEKAVIDIPRSAVFDPSPSPVAASLAEDHGLAVNPAIAGRKFDAVLIAVKPQTAAEAVPPFEKLAAAAPTISVMAGKSIASISELLPAARSIIRAMPNLPAAAGAGVTGLYAPPDVSDDDRAAANALMIAVGETAWVESERAIDVVTAVSGSGPAYFFLLGEALAEAARNAGLSREIAEKLARATLEGAGAFAAQDRRTLVEMRKAVTSPGGTTEAALAILDGDDRIIRTAILKAVEAARKRAAQLTD